MKHECLIPLGGDKYQCSRYGWTTTILPSAFPFRCDCNAGQYAKGPGDFLHDAILRWVGEAPTSKCSCKDRIRRMNDWGPVQCREHLDEIIDWMMGEAKQRGWWRYAVAVPGSRLFVKRMVIGAINQAEKAQPSEKAVA